MTPRPDSSEIEFDAIRDLPERRFLPGAQSHRVQRILCTRIGDTLQAKVRIECESATERFPLEERLYRLSPSGFEFGYLGAGPHALAWNILGLLLPPKEAHRLSQRFKEAFVAALDREGGVIEIARVRAWIQRVWAEEIADPERVAEEAELRRLLAEIEEADRLAAQEEATADEEAADRRRRSPLSTFRVRVVHVETSLSAIVEVEAETAHAAEVKVEQLIVYGGDVSDFRFEPPA